MRNTIVSIVIGILVIAIVGVCILFVISSSPPSPENARAQQHQVRIQPMTHPDPIQTRNQPHAVRSQATTQTNTQSATQLTTQTNTQSATQLTTQTNTQSATQLTTQTNTRQTTNANEPSHPIHPTPQQGVVRAQWPLIRCIQRNDLEAIHATCKHCDTQPKRLNRWLEARMRSIQSMFPETIIDFLHPSRNHLRGHEMALQTSLRHPHQHLVVVETGIEFPAGTRDLTSLFQSLHQWDGWDVVVLGYVDAELQHGVGECKSGLDENDVKQATGIWPPVAYIVNRNYIAHVYGAMHNALEGAEKTMRGRSTTASRTEALEEETVACRRALHQLQQRDRWYVLTPPLFVSTTP